MRILYYPDPVLQRRAEAVDAGREGLREFAEEMIRTMRDASGVGLAAPQVGEGLRLFVASTSGEEEDAMVFVNPRIEPFGPVVSMEEGCLSLPGVTAEITRPEQVRVKYEDVDGVEHEDEFDELLARIVQHECDHLEGVLFIDRMTDTDRIRVEPDLRTLKEQYRA